MAAVRQFPPGPTRTLAASVGERDCASPSHVVRDRLQQQNLTFVFFSAIDTPWGSVDDRRTNIGRVVQDIDPLDENDRRLWVT